MRFHAAAAVTVAIVAVGCAPATRSPTAAVVTPTVRQSSAPETVRPAGGPVPRDFDPRSFTAVGPDTWWIMGTAPCGAPPCTSIVRTVDAGRHFVGIPAPRAPYPKHVQPRVGVSELVFADARNGFAHIPQLYATHDGGGTWQQVRLGGLVHAFAVGDRFAYAVVGGRETGAPLHLMRARLGSDAWTTLHTPRVADSLAAHGSDVFVQLTNGEYYGDERLVSHDNGVSFVRYPMPMRGSDRPCSMQEVSASVVWALCSGGNFRQLYRSEDGGATFTLHRFPPDVVAPNGAPFAAASASTVVVGYAAIYRTTDAGRTFTKVADQPGQYRYWTALAFTTDARVGVALASEAGRRTSVYRTLDGGKSYSRVRIGG